MYFVISLFHACHIVPQDAHEFLCQCLDQLKQDVEKMNKSLANEAKVSLPLGVLGENGKESLSSTAKMEPGEEVDTSLIFTCPVVVNMEFEVQHTITCKG